MHAALPAYEYCPGAQLSQEVCPATENVPGIHCKLLTRSPPDSSRVQIPAGSVGYICASTGHAGVTDKPAGQQREADVKSFPGQYCPASHVVHTAAPSEEYWPAGQSMQAWDAPGAYLPAGQICLSDPPTHSYPGSQLPQTQSCGNVSHALLEATACVYMPAPHCWHKVGPATFWFSYTAV